MPYLISKVLLYIDFPTEHHIIEATLNTEIDLPFMAGEIQSLLPEEELLKNYVEHGKQSNLPQLKIVNLPLFNKGNVLNLSINLGQNSVCFIAVRPGYWIVDTEPDPSGIITDIYFSDIVKNDDRLVYGFYNITGKDVFSVTGLLKKDDENIYNKLKSNPTDIIWRRYIVRRALAPSGENIPAPSITYPENMTASQLAVYLQLKEKTIRNLTSEGKLPYLKIGGSVRYNKEEVDAALRKHRPRRNK